MQTVLKHKLLSPILQAIFPVLSAAPPPGQEDPEDEENDNGDGSDSESPKHYAAQAGGGDGSDSESPKHYAAQVIDTMALHMPPEKLFQQLMPLAQACLSSGNPYERKGGLMCLAVLAEGCADHIRTKMLSSMLQTVCQSLSDSNQVVRSAGLFALGQFSEHLQVRHLNVLQSAFDRARARVVMGSMEYVTVTREEIAPYLPTLMETMLSALNTAEDLKIRSWPCPPSEPSVANAAKELLVPYFPPVIESLKGFLTATSEEMRSLQTQALDTLSVLARTIGKDVFGPLAA
ncbi:LOW QUALITY PROTEIN: hypothetical protein CRUP_020267, partial [Coryphaenoides rupestris]